VILESERCYRALQSRDARFDGWFVTAVTSTGVYCRPSCPARTPKRENVRFYGSAAAAQQAGFRACLRCRPDAAPGSPEWSGRADVAARAVRLILDGAVDREGVAGVARRLGYSERQLHRVLVAEVGTGALALARVQRAQTARVLLTGSDLPITDVAFGAGFASVRQFNDTVRAVFGRTPTELRRRSREAPLEGRAQAIRVRLAYRMPMAAGVLLDFLGYRAIAGVEAYDGRIYRRTLRLPRGTAIVALEPDPAAPFISATFSLEDLRDLHAAIARCRRLLDLDADPAAIDAVLGADPLLGPLVARTPGIRVPGAVDGFELAVRAVLGQQVSVAGARTLAGRLVRAAGSQLPEPVLPLTHAFPTAAALADLADRSPQLIPVPASRRRTLAVLADAVATGELELDAGGDPDELARRLRAIDGIGPWTVAYLAMRVVGDPDAFVAEDLGVRRVLARLGAVDDPRAIAERWRPWRAYATAHLWNAPPQTGAVDERIVSVGSSTMRRAS
jgi:AraC family transcriptional regulator, regulatory protein of adaptative response / DNA-3-methyladenine glycosylase II